MCPATSPPDGGRDLSPRPRPVSVTENDGAIRYVYALSQRPPNVHLKHDPHNRLIRIVWPDGKTSVFRDEPVRILLVVPRAGP